MEESLEAIGRRYGTDKVTHGYLPHYERLFAPFRHRSFDLLEIGVRSGASIRMWHEYFPNARIVGLDLEPITLDDERELPRYAFVQGSQDDQDLLRQLTRHHAFRIVVDDGSHLWSHQISTFQTVFPALEAGGVYVCEDIHSSFGRRRKHFHGDAAESSADYFLRLAEAVIPGKVQAPKATEEPLPRSLVLKVYGVTFVRHGVIVVGSPAQRKGSSRVRGIRHASVASSASISPAGTR